MRIEMDMIQFEDLRELQAVMGMIEKYVKQNPEEKNNGTIKRLYNLLDVMEMSW